MWVTLYTDASYKAGDGAGWGVWLRSCEGRIVRRGPCPESVQDANHAEMHAIVTGIEIALSEWGKHGIEGIHVKTDSQTAIGVLKYGARPPRSPLSRSYQDRAKSLLAPSIKLKMVWIKGHQREDTTAAWLNARVDEASRRARNQAKKTSQGA